MDEKVSNTTHRTSHAHVHRGEWSARQGTELGDWGQQSNVVSMPETATTGLKAPWSTLRMSLTRCMWAGQDNVQECQSKILRVKMMIVTISTRALTSPTEIDRRVKTYTKLMKNVAVVGTAAPSILNASPGFLTTMDHVLHRAGRAGNLVII